MRNVFKEFWCILTLPIYLCTIPSMWVELFFFPLQNSCLSSLIKGTCSSSSMPSSTWTTSLGEPERFLSLPLILPQRPKTRFEHFGWIERSWNNNQLLFVFPLPISFGWRQRRWARRQVQRRREVSLATSRWTLEKNIHNLSTPTSVDGGVEEKRQSWVLSWQHLLLSMFHHGGPGGLKLRRPSIANFIMYYIGGCQEGDDVDGRQARQDWKGPPHTANTSPDR